MTDSWLDRILHRRLSRVVSAAAVRIGIAPNLITLASLAVGLGGAVSVARGTVGGATLGLGLYLAAVVLDHADGEVARLTGAESRLGHWLDIAADTTVHATLVLAMGAAGSAAGAGGAMGLGVLAAAGVVLSAAVASAWPMDRVPRRPAPRVARLLESLGNRHGFYAMLLAFLACLAVAPGLVSALLVVVALGSHAYWMGRTGVSVAGRARSRRSAGPGTARPPGSGAPPRGTTTAGRTKRSSDAAALCAGLPALLVAMLSLMNGQ
jgi:phosphatidylglycerophosphate synthase